MTDLTPLRRLLTTFAGRVNRDQVQVIERVQQSVRQVLRWGELNGAARRMVRGALAGSRAPG